MAQQHWLSPSRCGLAWQTTCSILCCLVRYWEVKEGSAGWHWDQSWHNEPVGVMSGLNIDTDTAHSQCEERFTAEATYYRPRVRASSPPMSCGFSSCWGTDISKKYFFMMLVFGKTKLGTFSKSEFSDKFLLWSKMFEGLKWMKAGFVIFSSEFHRWQRDWKSRIAFFLSIHLQNPSPTPPSHQQHDGDYHLDCGGIVGNWWGRSQARSPTFPSHCSVLLLLHILIHPFCHHVYHHHHCWICLPEYNFTKV